MSVRTAFESHIYVDLLQPTYICTLSKYDSKRRGHKSGSIPCGINLRWLKNSILLLTEVLTLSVRGHYTEVIIRRTWIVHTWSTSKLWVFLRELIPTGFSSRSPQRKWRNICNIDWLRSRMSVCQIIFHSLWAYEWVMLIHSGEECTSPAAEECTGIHGSMLTSEDTQK